MMMSDVTDGWEQYERNWRYPIGNCVVVRHKDSCDTSDDSEFELKIQEADDNCEWKKL